MKNFSVEDVKMWLKSHNLDTLIPSFEGIPRVNGSEVLNTKMARCRIVNFAYMCICPSLTSKLKPESKSYAFPESVITVEQFLTFSKGGTDLKLILKLNKHHSHTFHVFFFFFFFFCFFVFSQPHMPFTPRSGAYKAIMLPLHFWLGWFSGNTLSCG